MPQIETASLSVYIMDQLNANIDFGVSIFSLNPHLIIFPVQNMSYQFEFNHDAMYNSTYETKYNFKKQKLHKVK